MTTEQKRVLIATCTTKEELDEAFQVLGVVDMKEKVELLTDPTVRYFDISSDLEIAYFQLEGMWLGAKDLLLDRRLRHFLEPNKKLD